MLFNSGLSFSPVQPREGSACRAGPSVCFALVIELLVLPIPPVFGGALDFAPVVSKPIRGLVEALLPILGARRFHDNKAVLSLMLSRGI